MKKAFLLCIMLSCSILLTGCGTYGKSATMQRARAFTQLYFTEYNHSFGNVKIEEIAHADGWSNSIDITAISSTNGRIQFSYHDGQYPALSGYDLFLEGFYTATDIEFLPSEYPRGEYFRRNNH